MVTVLVSTLFNCDNLWSMCMLINVECSRTIHVVNTWSLVYIIVLIELNS